MKLSRKSDYALRAMMSLVGHYGQGPVSIRTLAERHDIPRKFLENIMLDLKSQGWVESVAGRDGDSCWQSRQSRSRWAKSCVTSMGFWLPSPAFRHLTTKPVLRKVFADSGESSSTSAITSLG